MLVVSCSMSLWCESESVMVARLAIREEIQESTSKEDTKLWSSG